MPAQPYAGPAALQTSRYAITHGLHPRPTLPYGVSDNAIATPAQILSINAPSTEIVATLNKDLAGEASRHVAAYELNVSTTVTNTRHLLTLLRESIQKASPEGNTDLQTVDSLWKELEQ